ncbi:hypothetical protein IC229_34910 [Spirosoma sp. BT702]|uniref:Uncharacterized protein n=1 Tax=Spirosoma profusum TaxID=2771354 RepID=A0A927AWV5_9BACT|nr:hypothetical protein [Spirosoma profusum]MBD2705841.1 hypothetical protein [Spirosoma profusum]
MNKLLIFWTILFLLATTCPLQAQVTNTNLFMGIANQGGTGSFNTTYGFRDNIAGATNFPAFTQGTGNTLVGANASNYTTGSDNTPVGFNAGAWYLRGSQNVFIGSGASGQFYAAESPTTSSKTMVGNSFVGYGAGYNNLGDYNVFVGHQSGYSNVTGTNNVFVGTNTGYANTGSSNTFLGYQAGQRNTTGSNNLFLG